LIEEGMEKEASEMLVQYDEVYEEFFYHLKAYEKYQDLKGQGKWLDSHFSGQFGNREGTHGHVH
jgi:hypothetical protein